MELDDVQRDLQALAHDFAEREMRPLARQYDESEEFPWPVVRKAAEVGLTCYDLPEEYGGGGVDSLVTRSRSSRSWPGAAPPWPAASAAAASSPARSSRSDPGAEGALAAAAVLADRPRHRRARDHRAERGLRRRRDGDGGREGRRRLRAERPEDVDLVRADGRPVHRVRPDRARLALAGHHGVPLLRGDEGFTIGKKIPKMGARCYPAAELFFEDCFVADDRRVGDEGQGFYGLMRWFDVSRVDLGANGVGIGRAALEYAVGLRQGARAVRQEDPRVPGRLVPPRGRQDGLDQARL